MKVKVMDRIESIPTIGDDGPLIHTYIHPKSRNPQPGDVAVCGWIKQMPHPAVLPAVPKCPRCKAYRA